MYTLIQGEMLAKAARMSIEMYLKNPNFNRYIIRDYTKKFKEKYGIFVTLEHYPTRTLRGCIGFLYGANEIGKLVIDAAIAAAFEDPRFVPVSINEFNELTIEVSVLSDQQILGNTAQARKRNLKIGRDGLIIEYGHYRGLLLPNVATEQHFDKDQFLECVCEKAGLPNKYWMQPNVKLFRFETQIFREETPNGRIVEWEHPA
jgi:hypothetical protein